VAGNGLAIHVLTVRRKGMPITIQGTGSYVPPRILHNRDLENILDTTDEWITQRTGVRERRIAEPDVTTSDLALEATKAALEMAHFKKRPFP
jgi:3-oxoacyl-[acyl-carrier-protein] synthase III